MEEAFLSYDHVLISKGYHDPIPHRHFAKHLIFSMNEEFECIVENERFYCNGICIDSNALHSVKCDSGNLLVFLFDGTSNLAGRLDEKYLKGETYCLINKDLTLLVSELWKNTKKDAKKLDEAILSLCGIKGDIPEKYDDRIYQILRKISEMEGIYEDTYNMLCESVYLSRSRVSHLFQKEVGISLSNYLILEKIRKAYKYVLEGENITTASVRAGFSSSSHFSNTHKRMFGLTYTDFIKTTITKVII